MDMPDFTNNFPANDNSMKIKPDLNNTKHGEHFDVLKAIEGGTDQVRVSPSGDIMGGTTNIGKAKMNWE